jgi:catechol 2,3-dioxygenase-like lactoylglutathione lyase family enzyme
MGNPFELFNAALEAFSRSEIPAAVALIRQGFFENLYIAPRLIGDEYEPQDIWYSGEDGRPLAAKEYVTRYGRQWEARSGALLFMNEVWNDSRVRAELRGFINLSKNLLSVRDSEFQDRLHERNLFMSPARLHRTQTEIISSLSKVHLHPPPQRPRMSLVLLASRNPTASVEFYRKLLQVEPTSTSRLAGGYAEFEFDGVHFGIHGQDRTAKDDPYLLGPPPTSLGWGAIFVFRVANFSRHYETALSLSAQVVDSDLTSKGRRYFVVKDPSGYLIELTEEDPKGLYPE